MDGISALFKQEPILWQPKGMYNGTNCSIVLDRDFALKCAELTLDEQCKKGFQRKTDFVKEQLGVKWPSVFSFYEHSFLIDEINLGSGGKWFSLEERTIREIQTKKIISPIEYFAHNIDIKDDAYNGIALFELWVSSAKVYLEMRH